MSKEFSDIDYSVFIADSADIIGDIKIGRDSSVWYNCVIRSDIEGVSVIIGERSNVQDGTVIHIDYDKSTIIGNDVTIGHNCTIHGCTIEDNVLIGMGAVILSGAKIGSNTIIAAGAVVKENSVIEANSLYAGVPARKVKDLGDEVVDAIRESAVHYAEFAKEHKSGKYKTKG